MKNFKKLIALILVVGITLGVVGCKAGTQSGNVDTSQYADRDIHLTLNYFDGGFGREWVYAVLDDYMQNVNKDVYVEVVINYDSGNALNELQSGVAADDIYLIDAGTYGFGDSLAEVSDVWESKAYGEDKLIKDKVNKDVYEFYNESGKYYQMPYCKELGMNWSYNVSTLNELLGEGNYVLPRTTDEFFALGDALIEKNANLAVSPYADTQGGNYTRGSFEAWFAQMAGYEGYRNYFDGMYKNDKGEVVLAEDVVAFFECYKDAIESAYEVQYKLCKKENHYMYSDSASLDYKGADQVFYGGGYGIKNTKVAAIFTGPWIELEVASMIEDGIIQEQELVTPKLPVISAITKRCDTVKDDTTLAAVVDYVDGVTETRPAGVSDGDIAIIKEARNIMAESRNKTMVIPACSDNIEEAKELLRYFASDRAQRISAQHADGINQLPFGYIPTEEDMGFELSSHVKSLYEKKVDAISADISHFDSIFQNVVSMSWCAGTTADVSDVSIFAGRGTDPKDIFASTVSKYNTKQWPLYIENYYLLTGK